MITRRPPLSLNGLTKMNLQHKKLVKTCKQKHCFFLIMFPVFRKVVLSEFPPMWSLKCELFGLTILTTLQQFSVQILFHSVKYKYKCLDWEMRLTLALTLTAHVSADKLCWLTFCLHNELSLYQNTLVSDEKVPLHSIFKGRWNTFLPASE